MENHGSPNTEKIELLLAVLAWICLLLAIVPALLFLRNLQLYNPPPLASQIESVSVLIPARNEERSIAASVRAALQSEHVDLELVVLDDHSEDRTAAIVEEIARSDHRVRLTAAPPLPSGWCGKQFACSLLASLAARPVLCFLDADVQLQPDGLARVVAQLKRSEVGLISGFPRQITRTPLEQLLLPLMHFLLLGFLPLDQMRKSTEPSLGAGCGQLLVADRDAYLKAGGHEAIRESRHDGIALPRAFRRAGLKTDLCDITGNASCRMYHSAREVVFGLLKNATEGLAAPQRIVPFSILLFFGQVFPLLLFTYLWIEGGSHRLLIVAGVALIASYLPRIVAALRFKQPFFAALLHPAAILVLLGIQWIALLRELLRMPATWKGRRYSTS